MITMQLIYKGAEAELWETQYLGFPVVVKRRIRKTYRIKQIDERIRKNRTRREAVMLAEARGCVNTPFVLSVDLKENTIIMQYLEGKTLKQLFLEGYKNKKKTSTEIGRMIKKLHDKGVIHGDLTTSNMIKTRKGIHFIDFGLSYKSDKTEDKAVDLLVFKKMLKSTHWKDFEEIWGAFKQGYGDETVLSKVEEIEKRARYA